MKPTTLVQRLRKEILPEVSNIGSVIAFGGEYQLNSSEQELVDVLLPHIDYMESKEIENGALINSIKSICSSARSYVFWIHPEFEHKLVVIGPANKTNEINQRIHMLMDCSVNPSASVDVCPELKVLTGMFSDRINEFYAGWIDLDNDYIIIADPLLCQKILSCSFLPRVKFSSAFNFPEYLSNS